MKNKKDVMQTKSTPEADKEQGEQKKFNANQINTRDRQRTRRTKKI
jgi:hypothetical protein